MFLPSNDQRVQDFVDDFVRQENTEDEIVTFDRQTYASAQPPNLFWPSSQNTTETLYEDPNTLNFLSMNGDPSSQQFSGEAQNISHLLAQNAEHQQQLDVARQAYFQTKNRLGIAPFVNPYFQGQPAAQQFVPPPALPMKKKKSSQVGGRQKRSLNFSGHCLTESESNQHPLHVYTNPSYNYNEDRLLKHDKNQYNLRAIQKPPAYKPNIISTTIGKGPGVRTKDLVNPYKNWKRSLTKSKTANRNLVPMYDPLVQSSDYTTSLQPQLPMVMKSFSPFRTSQKNNLVHVASMEAIRDKQREKLQIDLQQSRKMRMVSCIEILELRDQVNSIFSTIMKQENRRYKKSLKNPRSPATLQPQGQSTSFQTNISVNKGKTLKESAHSGYGSATAFTNSQYTKGIDSRTATDARVSKNFGGNAESAKIFNQSSIQSSIQVRNGPINKKDELKSGLTEMMDQIEQVDKEAQLLMRNQKQRVMSANPTAGRAKLLPMGLFNNIQTSHEGNRRNQRESNIQSTTLNNEPLDPVIESLKELELHNKQSEFLRPVSTSSLNQNAEIKKWQAKIQILQAKLEAKEKQVTSLRQQSSSSATERRNLPPNIHDDPLWRLLQKSSKLHSKMKNEVIQLQDDNLKMEREQYYDQLNQQRVYQQRKLNMAHNGDLPPTEDDDRDNLDLEDVEEIGQQVQKTTDMFDSQMVAQESKIEELELQEEAIQEHQQRQQTRNARKNYSSGQPMVSQPAIEKPAQVEMPVSMKEVTPDDSCSHTTKLTSSIFPSNMNESEKLSLQIKTLEQKLIERTSEVLQNTDMLKQFHAFKQETAFRSNEAMSSKKKRNLRSARMPEVPSEEDHGMGFQ